jgi:hypothetical protein
LRALNDELAESSQDGYIRLLQDELAELQTKYAKTRQTK